MAAVASMEKVMRIQIVGMSGKRGTTGKGVHQCFRSSVHPGMMEQMRLRVWYESRVVEDFSCSFFRCGRYRDVYVATSCKLGNVAIKVCSATRTDNAVEAQLVGKRYKFMAMQEVYFCGSVSWQNTPYNVLILPMVTPTIDDLVSELRDCEPTLKMFAYLSQLMVDWVSLFGYALKEYNTMLADLHSSNVVVVQPFAGWQRNDKVGVRVVDAGAIMPNRDPDDDNYRKHLGLIVTDWANIILAAGTAANPLWVKFYDPVRFINSRFSTLLSESADVREVDFAAQAHQLAQQAYDRANIVFKSTAEACTKAQVSAAAAAGLAAAGVSSHTSACCRQSNDHLRAAAMAGSAAVAKLVSSVQSTAPLAPGNLSVGSAFVSAGRCVPHRKPWADVRDTTSSQADVRDMHSACVTSQDGAEQGGGEVNVSDEDGDHETGKGSVYSVSTARLDHDGGQQIPHAPAGQDEDLTALVLQAQAYKQKMCIATYLGRHEVDETRRRPLRDRIRYGNNDFFDPRLDECESRIVSALLNILYIVLGDYFVQMERQNQRTEQEAQFCGHGLFIRLYEGICERAGGRRRDMHATEAWLTADIAAKALTDELRILVFGSSNGSRKDKHAAITGLKSVLHEEGEMLHIVNKVVRVAMVADVGSICPDDEC